jgi:23S rRNA (cytidine2498-2'-O)-methyltransferase
MSHDAGQFVFMTCRPGAEKPLKAEVACSEPEWRPAFSRPGFVTFKLPGQARVEAQRLSERHWTFAYSHGISVGRVAGTSLASLADQVWAYDRISAAVGARSFGHIHVWQPAAARDDDDDEAMSAPLCEEIETAVRAAAPDAHAKLRRLMDHVYRPSPRKAMVLDIAIIEPGEWWIGFHYAVTWQERWPGGRTPVRFPSHAVSRAYAKLDEAIQWSGLPINEGDECVEIGCAPGGASQALLDRGLFVTGIDPADVDPAVLEHPRFRHLKKRGKDVRRQEFEGVRWLVADMNVAPDATLDEVEPIVTHPGVSMRGLVLTLKLSDWSLAAKLPEYIERVRGWGYRDVRVRQLTTGGQEICLVALRRKALRRLGRKKSGRTKKWGVKRRDAPHSGPIGPHF